LKWYGRKGRGRGRDERQGRRKGQGGVRRVSWKEGGREKGRGSEGGTKGVEKRKGVG